MSSGTRTIFRESKAMLPFNLYRWLYELTDKHERLHERNKAT